MPLVIVESPAKCSKIQGFLGAGWKVLASMGHIRALVPDIKALHIQDGFNPDYEYTKDKAKTIAELRAAAKTQTVYLASDDDREGEAISYSVALALKLDPLSNPRIVFHEITKSAILKAIETPRTINMNRVNSQQARAVLDMMVGFTISPLLWKYVGPSLSAGRCQTPALRIIVEREKEIKNFTNNYFWKIRGNWKYKSVFSGTMLDDLEDEESTLNYLENVHTELNATVQSIETKPTTANPPLPLITSSLQQEASALFGSTPKNTMMAAQKLYEAGHITYMRTDSTSMCEEAVAEARAHVEKNYGKDYCGTPKEIQTKETKAKTKEIKAKAKKETKEDKVQPQEAHECIRPTHFEVTDAGSQDLEKKIYTLIYKRALQSIMAPAKGDTRTAKWIIDNDEFVHEGVWKRTTFQGWKIVGVSETKLDESEEEETQAWSSSEELKIGTQIKWTTLKAEQRVTKASPRYNEATLVRELEKKGIGRPSTFASLVGAITDKEYVKNGKEEAKEVKVLSYILTPSIWPPNKHEEAKKLNSEKNKMMPTELGIRVYEFCMKEFANLFDFEFTKHLEQRLDNVEAGEDWKQVCMDTYDSYKEKYAQLNAVSTKEITNQRTISLSNDYEAVLTRKGPFIIKDKKILGWPEGVEFEKITDDLLQKFLKPTDIIFGYYEDKPLIKKTGKFGEYILYESKNIGLKPGDTVESIIAKLNKPKSHEIGDYRFGTGAYGPYMMKKGPVAKGKKPIFVSIPAAIDVTQLTELAAKTIYENGVIAAKNKKVYK